MLAMSPTNLARELASLTSISPFLTTDMPRMEFLRRQSIQDEPGPVLDPTPQNCLGRPSSALGMPSGPQTAWGPYSLPHLPHLSPLTCVPFFLAKELLWTMALYGSYRIPYGLSRILYAPETLCEPHEMLYGPSRIVHGPSRIVCGPYKILRGPYGV